MIAACALVLAIWASAFPVVAFHGLDPARPAVAKQPRNPASVAIVHLRSVDIVIRNESPRSKHASGSQTSGVAATAAAIVATGGSGRIDLRSPKPHKVKAPVKPQSTPSAKPTLQPAEVVSLPPAAPSLVVTELSLVTPADSLAKAPVDTSPGAPVSNGGGSGSDRAGHDRPRARNDDQGNRKDRDRQSERRPGHGDRSGGRR